MRELMQATRLLVAGVYAKPMSARPRSEQIALLQALLEVVHGARVALLRGVRELESRGLDPAGVLSCGGPEAAAELSAQARLLDDPLMEAALLEGAASIEQVAAIAEVLDRLPPHVDANQRMTVGVLMIDAAADLNADELRAAGRRILADASRP